MDLIENNYKSEEETTTYTTVNARFEGKQLEMKLESAVPWGRGQISDGAPKAPFPIISFSV